ncbi:stress responsive alpha/beta barrel protein [Natranaerovirga pectinivora]|uniref:Stress responsive alpha/beta barrel protein n=1 Tax=Natranaerovirga pectinivora TaxID=682400 RepID=A0A4R3MK62_9FIRM|nr:Dabb family protein [Natranaerovirga pectinivora]TCT14675.1 stress responsive alpha/beta barrel protein [Natranaerovirga pectinivora]
MIKHIVMFKFKEEDKVEHLIKAKEMLEALKDRIDVIKFIEVKFNSQLADENNFDLILDSEFESMEDLNAYQVHEDHQEVVTFIRGVVEGRACIDYEK